VIKGNSPISEVKQGIFRLGELSRISMLMVLFCMICDEFGFWIVVLHLRELRVRVWVLLYWMLA